MLPNKTQDVDFDPNTLHRLDLAIVEIISLSMAIEIR
jgi:hypothetical protein